MEMLNISRLQSGGVITNYNCPSQCRHCLYNCSPRRPKDYLDKDTAKDIFNKIEELGCRSVHIGGGEPFVQPDKLKIIAETAREYKMGIEYIETNAAWHTDEARTHEILHSLLQSGVGTLLISISPFHNEYIPFSKTKALMLACRKAGMKVFPWVMDFYSNLQSFDENITHSLEEYRKMFGENYIKEIPGRCWIHFGGRALKTFSKIYPLKPLNLILEQSAPCRELSDVSHFHIDLYGNYIPGLCTGFSIQYPDLGKPLDASKYPFINMLYTKGIKAFCEWAKENFAFIPDEKYLSKCHLCNHIRHFIINVKKQESIELQPKDFYATSAN
jgi:hypothetical protein